MSSPFLFVKTAVVKISISTRKEGGVVHSSCAYADVAGILICLSGVCAYAYVLMKTTLDSKVFFHTKRKRWCFLFTMPHDCPCSEAGNWKSDKVMEFPMFRSERQKRSWDAFHSAKMFGSMVEMRRQNGDFPDQTNVFQPVGTGLPFHLRKIPISSCTIM